MNSFGKELECFPRVCEASSGEVRFRMCQSERVGWEMVGAGVAGAGGRRPAVNPAVPRLGRIQAPGGAAAGEEPLAAVREHRPAHLQQRPER